MLKGIDPRLNTDVLAALHGMGHGDLLALVDTNFPAQAVARPTVTGRLLRLENLTAAQAAQAILSVFPLDTFVDDFALRMQVVGEPHAIPPVQAEVQAEIDRAEGRARPMQGIDRFAFYDLARTAYAVVQTGERRFYGCVLLRKGVIAPDA
ncbi:MAG TPA: RbsD/FucU domain-containing protein [Paracoccaceae bacterium]|nr:RbsD/FucU domain-containing protein [Paracoccaceae bacterium]